MGIRDDIQAELSEAMADDLEDVVVSFDLVKKELGTYDPITDSRDETTSNTTSKGIFSSFGAQEIDGINVKSEDEKLIVNGFDLDVSPEIDDVILLESGKEYIIKKPNAIMGGGGIPIIYKMQIRKNA